MNMGLFWHGFVLVTLQLIVNACDFFTYIIQVCFITHCVYL